VGRRSAARGGAHADDHSLVGAREGSYAVVIITVPRGRPGGIRERAGAECGNAAVLSSRPRTTVAPRSIHRRCLPLPDRTDGPHPVIRILLVDDHQIVRSGVRRVLEATGRFDIAGEAAGVREALDRTRSLTPDVIVLDLNLRDGSGLDAIAEMRAHGARVVVLSMQDEPAYARKAFELGAQGYVVKDAADAELVDAIDVVLDDRIYVHPTLAARLVMREPEDDLTERERQILRLIALGYTNQEIAGQLFLSVRTIEAHRRHILDKLRLSTRAELVRYALERRIVDIGTA